jgi:hypothetical protein
LLGSLSALNLSREAGTSDARRPSDSDDVRPSLGWRAALVLVVLVVVVHALSPSVQVGDSRLSVPVATAVVRDGTLDLRGDRVVERLRNRYDIEMRGSAVLPFFPWVPMLFAVPGVIVSQLVGRDPAALKPSRPNQTWVIEVPTASALVALTSLVLAWVAFDVAGGLELVRRRRLAVASGLVYAFATAAWSTGSRALWQHAPSMLFLALALLCALRMDRRGYAFGFGGALAFAYVSRPTNAVSIAVLLAWLVITNRDRLVLAIVGALVVAVPFSLVNLAAYGAVLPSYFSAGRLGPEAAIGFVDAMFVYLVSPSRGLLIYDPVIVLAALGVWLRVHRRTFVGLDAAIAAVVVLHYVVIVRYGSTGGGSYGPRLMTDMMPFIVYLAIPAIGLVVPPMREFRMWSAARRVGVVLIGAVIVWSFAVNAVGAVTRSAYCWSATPVAIDRDASRLWDWSDPQFLRPVQRARAGDSLRQLVVGSCAQERAGE